ncbi:MAG: hypothetical protein JXJ04_05075 [Spirochaetales bacterium]|nr:hypothetical protein [Spirochaetales bacterium]
MSKKIMESHLDFRQSYSVYAERNPVILHTICGESPGKEKLHKPCGESSQMEILIKVHIDSSDRRRTYRGAGKGKKGDRIAINA